MLLPDLATSQRHSARFEVAELPVQRIVLILSVLVAVVTKLTEWMGDDAIRFEVLFVPEAGRTPLAEEAALCELLVADGHRPRGASTTVLPATFTLLDPGSSPDR